MKTSFLYLYVTLVIAILCKDANSLPTTKKRSTGTVVLPLKRVDRGRDNIHPQLLLQQQLNNAHRRMARMTGVSEPSEEEMRKRMVKRLHSLPGNIAKRYNVQGTDFTPVDSFSADGSLSFHVEGTENGSNVDADSLAENSLHLDIVGIDVSYTATIQIGSPPRDFSILMDSGSGDFWVGSEDCLSEETDGDGCGNHVFLGNLSSTSFVDTQTPFDITYGSGHVSGTKVKDTVVMAGLTLSGHEFGVANTESKQFSDANAPFDGLMGLGKSSLSTQKVLTPVEALAAGGLINEAITSYKISRRKDGTNDGEITFGGLDPAKFDQSTLVTVPNINKVGFWEVSVNSSSVDGVSTGLDQRTAILDTGTTLFVGPTADVKKIHSLIDGAEPDGNGGFTVPCDTNATVALTIGGREFAIDSRDLAFGNIGNGRCISGIGAADGLNAPTQWLVGDTFLKNVYLSTNVDKNEVSLAKLT
ncbi:acid protease [Dendrothele bispora CBS 962.96]|uniref:Acid protease n=1 Tax=Dendrothele bispora (strain CBS 962.96) TaxID=1314807 RepID=A0A4S8MK68_DENBC|nr:acid protease [Dendrothele bispora CBS 962.96]